MKKVIVVGVSASEGIKALAAVAEGFQRICLATVGSKSLKSASEKAASSTKDLSLTLNEVKHEHSEPDSIKLPQKQKHAKKIPFHN